MSSVSEPETVADRVRELIRTTPPKTGRNSRLGHISVEDFADLLGTTKARVIEWRKGDAYPDARNREKLAAVSAGRYTVDDFKGPATADRAEMSARLEELEGEVASLRAALADFVEAATERMAALEAAPARATRRSAQPSTPKTRAAK